MGDLIKIKKSIIPFCHVSTLKEFEDILDSTKDIEEVGGYIIGLGLALKYGLKSVVDFAHRYTSKPLIYDHQKAGTDIPYTGKEFVDLCKKSGIDAIILFPMSGPETEKSWIEYALKENLKVIVGGIMSHPQYLNNEKGFITDKGSLEIYKIASRMGVTDFIVPGTKLEYIQKIKEVIKKEGINPILYSPGFGSQGGKISGAVKILGENFHLIIGRGIYDAQNKEIATREFCEQLE